LKQYPERFINEDKPLSAIMNVIVVSELEKHEIPNFDAKLNNIINYLQDLYESGLVKS
jgi:hypothetical protein